MASTSHADSPRSSPSTAEAAELGGEDELEDEDEDEDVLTTQAMRTRPKTKSSDWPAPLLGAQLRRIDAPAAELLALSLSTPSLRSVLLFCFGAARSGVDCSWPGHIDYRPTACSKLRKSSKADHCSLRTAERDHAGHRD